MPCALRSKGYRQWIDLFSQLFAWRIGVCRDLGEHSLDGCRVIMWHGMASRQSQKSHNNLNPRPKEETHKIWGEFQLLHPHGPFTIRQFYHHDIPLLLVCGAKGQSEYGVENAVVSWVMEGQYTDGLRYRRLSNKNVLHSNFKGSIGYLGTCISQLETRTSARPRGYMNTSTASSQYALYRWQGPYV